MCVVVPFGHNGAVLISVGARRLLIRVHLFGF